MSQAPPRGPMKPSQKSRVQDVMIPKPIIFTPDMDLLEAARVLADRQISGAPVVDEKGTLIGVLTERDYLEAALIAGYHGEGGGRVRDYMSCEVQAVSVDDTLLDVAPRFVNSKHRRFPVMEDNRVVGLVTRRDVLKAVLDSAS